MSICWVGNIVPDVVGFIPVYQLFKERKRILAVFHALWDIVVQDLSVKNWLFCKAPVQSAREVDTHVYPLPSNCRGQFSDYVPLHPLLIELPMRIENLARPQSESVVMSCGRNDVPSPNVLEELRPCIGIPLLYLLIENRDKVEITEILPVGFYVMFPR